MEQYTTEQIEARQELVRLLQASIKEVEVVSDLYTKIFDRKLETHQLKCDVNECLCGDIATVLRS